MAGNPSQLVRSRQIDGHKTVTADSRRVLSCITYDPPFLLFKSLRLGMLFKKRYGYGDVYAQKFDFIFC
jgi:hypothetical protein